jgi:IS30 family transposase
VSSLSEKSEKPGRPAGRRKYTREEREGFFRVLERAGSVAAAAAELGLNRATCFGWVRKVRGPGHRRYTPEEREGFLRVLERAGSVAAAAAGLGFNLSTCHRWARAADIPGRPGGRLHPGREEFFRLRASGMSRNGAAAAAGIHPRTAGRWEAQSRHPAGRGVRTGGPAGGYKQGVDTPTVPGLPALEKTLDLRYLSLDEREKIRDLLKAGASVRKVASALGRAPSTVGREIARNSDPQLGYLPHGAHRKAAARRPRPKEGKLGVEGPLRSWVRDRLRIRWSPEQISRTLITQFPHNPEMRVSPETIYQALYLQARGGLRREIAAALRTGRARRKPRRTAEERRPRFADPMVMISDRPPEAGDRAVPGHWEGDLITGAFNRSAIGTLVERTTRYVMLVHLPADHGAEAVRDGLVKTMSTLPEHLRGSLTWDQGAEMAAHRSFSLATGMDVYFCDPASPWQRGSNENTNGLLRQYFPKGTDLSAYGPEDLEHVAQELNGRPRKTLGWATPAERLRDLPLTT